MYAFSKKCMPVMFTNAQNCILIRMLLLLLKSPLAIVVGTIDKLNWSFVSSFFLVIVTEINGTISDWLHILA